MRVDAAHSQVHLQQLSRPPAGPRDAAEAPRPGSPGGSGPAFEAVAPEVTPLTDIPAPGAVPDTRPAPGEGEGKEHGFLRSRLARHLERVDSRVDNVLGSDALDERQAGAIDALRQGFHETIEGLVADLQAGEGNGRSAFVHGFRAAQEELARSVRDIVSGEGEPTDPQDIPTGGPSGGSGKDPTDIAGAAGQAAPAAPETSAAPDAPVVADAPTASAAPEIVATAAAAEAPRPADVAARASTESSSALDGFLRDLQGLVAQGAEQAAAALPEILTDRPAVAADQALDSYRQSVTAAASALATPHHLDAFG